MGVYLKITCISVVYRTLGATSGGETPKKNETFSVMPKVSKSFYHTKKLFLCSFLGVDFSIQVHYRYRSLIFLGGQKMPAGF